MKQPNDEQLIEGLYREFSVFIKNYGEKKLLHYLFLLNETEDIYSDNITTHQKIAYEMNKASEMFGLKYTYLFFQSTSTKLIKFNFKESQKLNDKLVEIITHNFDTTLDYIIDGVGRDGVRVYASGTLFKLQLDVCGYSVNDVIKMSGKPRSIISRHKTIVQNLDYKHPYDKIPLKKYVKSKKQLINFILNEFQKD